jgi:hypothetical protein
MRLNIFKALDGLSPAMYSTIFFKSFSAIFDHTTSYFLFISICLSENFQYSQRFPAGTLNFRSLIHPHFAKAEQRCYRKLALIRHFRETAIFAVSASGKVEFQSFGQSLFILTAQIVVHVRRKMKPGWMVGIEFHPVYLFSISNQ